MYLYIGSHGTIHIIVLKLNFMVHTGMFRVQLNIVIYILLKAKQNCSKMIFFTRMKYRICANRLHVLFFFLVPCNTFANFHELWLVQACVLQKECNLIKCILSRFRKSKSRIICLKLYVQLYVKWTNNSKFLFIITD